MSKPIVAFLNLPWHFVDEHGVLRRGIRGGSRWPFSTIAPAPMGSRNVPLGHYLPTPWFLFSAAGWAQRALPDHQIIVRDSIARYETFAEFDEWWQVTAPDFVVIETGSPCWENDWKFIKAMKRSNPDVRIAVYGPNAREIERQRPVGVDAILLGEPDKLVPKFVLEPPAGPTIYNFDLLTRDELADAPYPIFDEDVAHHYADSNPRMERGGHPWPELTIWGTRGCFAVCQFCSWPATMTNDDPLGKGGRKIRFYSADWLEGFIWERRVAAEKAGHPIKAIRFDGDMENAGNKHTRMICSVMRKVGLPWSMMCRADTVDREVWKEMKDSGCFGAKIGFESASDRIVNEVVGKKLDLKAAEETCRLLRSIGMSVHTTWQVNAPTETPEEQRMTLDMIRRFYVENVHNSHQISGMAVIDGTPLANSAVSDPAFVRDPDGQHKVEQILKK